MIYSKEGLIIAVVLLGCFVISHIFLKKYKLLPIVIPFDGRNKVINLFHRLIIFFLLLLILLIPFNIGVYQGSKIEKIPTLNIQILFDVSLSMTAKDIKPDRFIATKKALIQFIKVLDLDYNIGLIAFSGKPLVWIPFSSDKKALIWKISHMNMSDFLPSLDFVGTSIGDALLLGAYQLLHFSKGKKQPGVILLLTDGDSNKGVNPIKAVKYIRSFGIPVFVSAIGNKKDYIVGEDIFGTEIPTNIDLNTLKQIAQQTSGEFMKIKKEGDLLKILENLKKYIKNNEKVIVQQEYMYINYYILLILLFLLTIYAVLYIKFKL